MKKKNSEKEAKKILEFTINILDEVENILEQDYCSVCVDKQNIKTLKKNSQIIFKAYSEIINKKKLNIK